MSSLFLCLTHTTVDWNFLNHFNFAKLNLEFLPAMDQPSSFLTSCQHCEHLNIFNKSHNFLDFISFIPLLSWFILYLLEMFILLIIALIFWFLSCLFITFLFYALTFKWLHLKVTYHLSSHFICWIKPMVLTNFKI